MDDKDTVETKTRISTGLDAGIWTAWDYLKRYFGGETGIRTPDRLLTYTRFPGVRLQPLIHLSYMLHSPWFSFQRSRRL
jgi:hypothetical protein